MSNENAFDSTLQKLADADSASFSRRKFFKFTSAGAAVMVLSNSCRKNDFGDTKNGVNLGGGDIGVLNYAYALEQLEASFYTNLLYSPYKGMSAMEMSYLRDVRDHEIAHREFFKATLGASAIPSLEVNFSNIDFSSRDSVLGTAKAFEDLGVAAYNGAGKLLQSADYLSFAGKIVSVEARHAAIIRDLISPGSFADMTAVDANGLDKALSPNEVLSIAGAFIKTKINAAFLPTL